MKKGKFICALKKAPFPAIMTIISFALFLVIYYLATARSVESYYFKALIFAVPAICFGIVTFFTAKGKLKIIVSTITTSILIVILTFVMIFAYVFMIFDIGTKATRDIRKYERVLKLSNYPQNQLIEHFPSKIPNSAKNIIFNYNPAFLQGGENYDLKFEIDSDSINKYIEEFSKQSSWIGKAGDTEAAKKGIAFGTFSTLGYSDLPKDFTIYLIDSNPYKSNDWNHGQISLVAISKQRNEIIFLAEDW